MLITFSRDLSINIGHVIVEKIVHFLGFIEDYWSVTRCHFKNPTRCSGEQQSNPEATCAFIEDDGIKRRACPFPQSCFPKFPLWTTGHLSNPCSIKKNGFISNHISTSMPCSVPILHTYWPTTVDESHEFNN